MALGNSPAPGYFQVGATAPPSNTTPGDITGVRGHFGTDAAFTSTGLGVGLEVNAKYVQVGGTLAENTNSVYAAKIAQTFTGTADNLTQLGLLPVYQPSASISSLLNFVNSPTASPPLGVTISDFINNYCQSFFGNVAGAVTRAYGILVYPPSIAGSLKPATNYGIYVTTQGAAGITTAIGIQIDKPTNATNNYYMSFDTNNAAALGAYQGKLPVIVGGVAGFIPWYL